MEYFTRFESTSPNRRAAISPLRAPIKHGPMRRVPFDFAGALMSALADTTIDFMIREPATADSRCRDAFEALWRMIG